MAYINSMSTKCLASDGIASLRVVIADLESQPQSPERDHQIQIWQGHMQGCISLLAHYNKQKD